MSLLVPNNFNLNAKDMTLPELIPVAAPLNAQAEIDGVGMWEVYRSQANPCKLYLRTGN